MGEQRILAAHDQRPAMGRVAMIVGGSGRWRGADPHVDMPGGLVQPYRGRPAVGLGSRLRDPDPLGQRRLLGALEVAPPRRMSAGRQREALGGAQEDRQIVERQHVGESRGAERAVVGHAFLTVATSVSNSVRVIAVRRPSPSASAISRAGSRLARKPLAKPSFSTSGVSDHGRGSSPIRSPR